MPLPNRLGAVVALIAIGLLASFGLAWPARDIELYGLSFTLSGRMLLGLVLVGLTWTGTDAIVRQHPKIQPKQSSLSALHCILPVAWTAAAWTLLARLDSIEMRLVGVTVSSGLLALLIIAEYYVVDLAGRWRVPVQFSLRLMAYLMATLLHIAIRLGISARLTATIIIAAVSAILAWKLLSDDRRPLQHIPAPDAAGRGPVIKIAGYSLMIGTAGHGLAAQIARHGWLCVLGLGILSGVTGWLLNLWMVSPLVHSLVLVVFLYVGVGIARHFLLGKLTQRVALEYLLVGVAVLLLLLSYAR